MMSAKIEGATRTLGERQGYTRLDIRDAVVDCPVNGPDTAFMTSAWQPDAQELAALNAGATIHVHIMGTMHPPIMVGVGPEPD